MREESPGAALVVLLLNRNTGQDLTKHIQATFAF